MSEGKKETEVNLISREQVIEAFKPIVELGINHPDNIPVYFPVAKAANKKLDAWIKQELNFVKQKGTQDGYLEYSLSASTIMVDAGFNDPGYIDNVVESLETDLESANRAGLAIVAQKIQAKIDAIKNKNKFN